MNILSIQSWVAYGHVGNASAVFPLQRLGAEVWAVNTVQFSNHPGYGSHAGQVFSGDMIAALVNGIADRGVLASCDGVLSGYVGDAATGAVIQDAADQVRTANPRAIWCCDPVMGDDGPGLYVRPDIPAFFRDQAVPSCDVLTPNQFELGLLTGASCNSLIEVKAAVSSLRDRMRRDGPRIVLVTSLATESTPADALDLLVGSDEGFSLLRTPRLAFGGNGAGDAMAALFLFHLLQAGRPATALENAASSVHGLIRRTVEAGSRELLTVAAQQEFVKPAVSFTSEAC